jgi:hypothetical protein
MIGLISFGENTLSLVKTMLKNGGSFGLRRTNHGKGEA